MNPKVVDKIATTVLYIVSGIIIVILASLLGYILLKGYRIFPGIFSRVQHKALKLEAALAFNCSTRFIF